MKVSYNGVLFIGKEEGYRSRPYVDANGHSIGFGHFLTAVDRQSWAKNLDTLQITDAQGKSLLTKDLITAENAVNKNITAKISQSQFDALVSLAYNIGSGNFSHSDVITAVNQAKGPTAVRAAFAKHIYSQGKVFAPLIGRRSREVDLYTGQSSDIATAPSGSANKKGIPLILPAALIALAFVI